MMKRAAVVGAFAFLVLSFAKSGTEPNRKPAAGEPQGHVAILWRQPDDISSRDLFWGPGGKEHAPHGRFTFQKEDSAGSSPKFDVVDQDGVRWRVKLGPEARPETAASRLLWAVGYFANEDYFLPVIPVDNMQRLRRGKNFVAADNVYNVRLKRHVKEQEKLGSWSWAKNPFVGTRELFGLRVMMALMNNWDLKDINNSVYSKRGSTEDRYVVSDLGGSFGPTGLNWKLKGDPDAYCNSKWIKASSGEFIDFNVPGGPAANFYVLFPELVHQLSMQWIGHHIPRSDAKWIGDLLGRLSPDQIHNAFRAAGYSSPEIERLTGIIQQRIAELRAL